MSDTTEALRFGSRSEFDAEVSRRRDSVPEVASAYRPSGKSSMRSAVLLLGGALVGAGVGAAAALAALALGVVLSMVAVHLPLYGSIPELLSTAVAAASVCTTIIPLGLVSGGLVGRLSVRGHNRNVAFASLAGGLAGAGGSVLFWLYLAPWGIGVMGPVAHGGGSFPDFVLRVATSGGSAWFCLAVGGAIATFLSLAVADRSVSTEKYCEGCGRFMSRRALTGIPWSDASALAKELAVSGMAAWRPIAISDSPDDASVDVFRCPECGQGYLEVLAHLHGQWPHPEKPEKWQTRASKWRIASLRLNAAEIDSVRLFGEGRGEQVGWLR